MEQIIESLKLVEVKYLLIFTLILIVLDIATGVWVAIFIKHDFNSKVLTEGCAKKVLYLALLFITIGLDYLLKTVGVLPIITKGYCVILIVANIKSIFENTKDHIILPDFKKIKENNYE